MYFIFFVFTAKASHDSDSDHLSILYGVIAVLCISFVVIDQLIVIRLAFICVLHASQQSGMVTIILFHDYRIFFTLII